MPKRATPDKPTEEVGATTAEPVEPPETADMFDVKLKEFDVGSQMILKIKDELGATTVDDLALLNEADLVGVGMKPVQARKLLASVATKVAPEAASTATSMGAVSFDDVLPSVPSDESWMSALRAGGVSKIDQSSVIGAIRATLASRVGMYDIPAKLVKAMEEFADSVEEQVDPEFFKIRKQLTRRSFPEIFEAIEGLDGNFVTNERKQRLLSRMDQSFWPAVNAFNDQLQGWQQAWMQGAANPGVMMMAFMNSSGGGNAMPPGMMQPPDTGVLHDHADAVADAVNKAFAGTGVQISAALAYEASKIRETLENPRLPSMIGAANREQMLRQLGVAVSATYPRLELNITRYAMSVMQLKDQPSGDEELRYISSLFMLGSQIPWDQLSTNGKSKLSGIGAAAIRGFES